MPKIVPTSHPIVREAPHEYEAAMKQKDESLKDFEKKYPQHNKIWWDEKNGKLHKFNDFGNKMHTIDYYWYIGENFKNGVIVIEKLDRKGEKLALYGLSQQSKFGDVKEDKPSIWYIKDYFKHGAWEKMKGTSQEEARKQFIQYSEALLAKKFCTDEKIVAEAKKEIDAMDKRFG